MRQYITIIFFCIALIALFFSIQRYNTDTTVLVHPVSVPPEPHDVAEARIRTTVASMSIEEKVGQLFMVSFSGTTLADAEAAWLESHAIGGVILMGGNVTGREQSRALIADIHRRVSMALPAPLLVATDQEGGGVSRFTFFNPEEQHAQNEIKTATEAFALGKLRGALLSGLGVDINFSPVVDIAQTPDDFMVARAFSGDAETVGKLGAALIRGYQESGVLPTAKHFPGHGGTLVDSHRNLPVVHRDERAWNEHLAPFRTAIVAGVPLIMTAHLLVPEMDATYPASISPAITTGVLRDGLGFDGVIITDDLAMGAITDAYTLTEAAVLALDAGADILLILSDHASVDRAITTVTEAVESGKISEERINESIKRILLLKEARERRTAASF